MIRVPIYSPNRKQAAGSSKRSFRGLRQKSISVIATKSMGIATKNYKGVNPLHYIKSFIESFRLNRSLLNSSQNGVDQFQYLVKLPVILYARNPVNA